MNIDDSETSEKRYTLRPSYTPLPSKAKASAEGNQSTTSAEPHSAQEKIPDQKPQISEVETTEAARSASGAKRVIRAANEDDDLYDPYSDYHDGTLKAAEFEEDPWR